MSLLKLDHSTIPFWIVFAVAWTAYASTYLLRKPIGVLKSPYGDAKNLTNTQMGLLDLALLLPYALVQMTLGSLTDRLGPRLTLSICMFGSGLSLLGFKFNQKYVLFLLMLLLSGSFQSFCWSACNSGISLWQNDPQRRHVVLGAFGTSPFAGGVLGTLFAVHLLEKYGWQSMLLWPSIICVVMSFATYFAFHYPPKDVSVARRRQNVLTVPGAFQTALAVLCLKVVRYGLYFWLPLQLERDLGYTTARASQYSVLFDVGAALGCLVSGKVLAIFFKSNALVGSAVQTALSAVALVLFIILAKYGAVVVCLCIALVGALNGAPDVILCGIVPAELVGGNDQVAAMIGFINGLGSIGGMIEGPLIGLIADYYSWTGVSLSMIMFSVAGAGFCLWANFLDQRNKQQNKRDDENPEVEEQIEMN